jgi:septal ring factor EnvC (AmiA/AmiB activator)
LALIAISNPAQAKSALETGLAIKKLYDDVKEFYDNANELLEWCQWTQETGLRMLDRKPARPAPGTLNGEKFEKRLEGSVAKIEGLTLPAFTPVEADLVGLGALSADDRRTRLRNAVASLQTPLTELSKARRARDMLDRALAEVVEQAAALSATADMAPEIIAKFPTVQIYEQFTLAFASIHLSYLPINTKLQDAIKDKQSEFDKDIATEVQDIKRDVNYILDALSLEQTLLKDDVDRIKSNFDEVAQEQQTLDDERSRVSTLGEAVRQLDAEVQATKLDLEEASERHASLQTSVNNLNNELSIARQQYHELGCQCNRDCYISDWALKNPLAVCPFRLPAYWVDSVLKVIAKQNQISSSLQQTQAALATTKNQVAQLRSGLASRNTALSDAKAKLRQAEEEVSALQVQVDEHRKAAEKEQYESRADVYAAQGLQDQNMIRAAIAGL